MSTDLTIDSRLSYSSAQKLIGCEQKFYLYKTKAATDPSLDEQDWTALIVGKSYHDVLEFSLHKKPANIKDALAKCTRDHGLTEEHYPMVHAMVLSYLRLRKNKPLKCLGVELELTNKKFLGFVDAIMEDEDGKWWILDLKTAGQHNRFLPAKLKRDTQLNLYASFYESIAKALKLDPKDFGGCLYNVVIKPKLKQRATEAYTDYMSRMTTAAKCYEYKIPAKSLTSKAVMKQHLQYQKKGADIISGKVKPACNFSNCESWFRPCEYWDTCYGTPYKEALEELELTTSIQE